MFKIIQGNVVKDLSKALGKIPEYATKWVSVATCTHKIERENLEISLGNLYESLGFARPECFIFYESPRQAFSACDQWIPLTGKLLLCYWSYHLPLLDPDGYAQQYEYRQNDVDLSLRPRLNPSRLEKPQKGMLISKDAIKKLWEAFDMLEVKWADDICEHLSEDPVVDRLQCLADSENPSNQIGIEEYLFLGPLEWAIREVACLDFCKSILGCKVNPFYMSALEGILRYGSLAITFEKLCLIIERPLEILGKQIVYRDGSQIHHARTI